MNLDNYFDLNKLKENKDTFKNIFFYRICGTGMGAAACLLKNAGYNVAGADSMFYPPMSTYLEESGIDIFKLDEITMEQIHEKYDLIVVGNVVARNSDLARAVEESKTPFCSFPSALGAFVLDKKHVIGISGTHGKTTTTYMGLQVFEKLGEKPGYLIGGVLDGRPSAIIGEGKCFFIESDEYDSAYFEKYSKFQSYCINDLVITSVEYDHADIFETIEDIKDEFRNLLPKVDKVIACEDWPVVTELKEERLCSNWIDYGKRTIKILEQSNMGTKFSLRYRGEEKVFKTNAIGVHNILNLSTIITVALDLGHSEESVNKAIKELKMVRRRQEIKGTYKGSDVIDDFAHHPTAVKETISALKQKYPNKLLNIYLEPGSATARSDIFQDRFLDSLLEAARVTIIKPLRKTTAIGRGDLDCEKLAKSLNSQGIETVIVSELEELLKELESHSDEKSVQVVMSNSSCLGLWSSEFVKSI